MCTLIYVSVISGMGVQCVCVCACVLAYSFFIRDFNFTLFLRPPGGADHITDDVGQGRGNTLGERP